jgi:hypothetical protein
MRNHKNSLSHGPNRLRAGENTKSKLDLHNPDDANREVIAFLEWLDRMDFNR